MAVVLVVEDDSDLLGVLAEALAEEGWSVFSSASAAGAIERARSLNMGVDVVLCDLLLASGEDGVALEAAFRADSALQGVPFVFMTGSSKVGAPPESRARVLFKPFGLFHVERFEQHARAGFRVVQSRRSTGIPRARAVQTFRRGTSRRRSRELSSDTASDYAATATSRRPRPASSRGRNQKC